MAGKASSHFQTVLLKLPEATATAAPACSGSWGTDRLCLRRRSGPHRPLPKGTAVRRMSCVVYSMPSVLFSAQAVRDTRRLCGWIEMPLQPISLHLLQTTEFICQFCKDDALLLADSERTEEVSTLFMRRSDIIATLFDTCSTPP